MKILFLTNFKIIQGRAKPRQSKIFRFYNSFSNLFFFENFSFHIRTPLLLTQMFVLILTHWYGEGESEGTGSKHIFKF